jgi:alpha-tubulin suppressor-like RCC1 family protein
LHCTGLEACDPGATGANAFGCVAGAPVECDPEQRCDEGTSSCVLIDCDTPDDDGDGHASLICGGDDCDDADGDRFPSNPEICDDLSHDEDCDPTTVGFRDGDADGVVSNTCCNLDAAGESQCGADCDDVSIAVNTGQPEFYDAVDNDCDGTIDEDTAAVEWFRDEDGDGFGVGSQPLLSCVPPVGFSRLGTDCDDTVAGVSPVGVESCEGTDQDCDGFVDEAGVCGGPDCVARLEVCDSADNDCDGDVDEDGACGGCMPATEGCNGRDDDCDDVVDEGGVCAPRGIIDVSAGLSHTCAVTVTGGLLCWGRNQLGQVGSGTTDLGYSVPTAVTGVDDETFVDVEAGSGATCARTVAGRVFCFGDNSHGELGAGLTDVISRTPVAATGLDDVIGLGTGYWHHCAVRASGAVWCWGQNESGELGTSVAGGSSNVPVATWMISDAIAVTAGDGQTCALIGDGRLRCWGYNAYGSVGDGSTVSSAARRDILGGARAASAGGQPNPGLHAGHTCALTGAGVLCWGDNPFGQLGDGTTTTQLAPVVVDGTVDVTRLDAGGEHTCVVRRDGTAWCWGWNEQGQLGDDTRTERHAPTRVVSLTAVDQISAGGEHTCARHGGVLSCWGAGTFGQRGDGSTDSTGAQRPVVVSLPD